MSTRTSNQIMSVTDWGNLFQAWKDGPSQTEQTKCENAERMIRDAIISSPVLSQRNVSVFAQGSYRNKTNVRQDSDVDICVLCKDVFFYELEHLPGVSPEALGIIPASYTFAQYRDEVGSALNVKFGNSGVASGDKAFDVHSNTYRVDADVVPAFLCRYYYKDRTFTEGVAILSRRSSKRIFNYPELHWKNGSDKHASTKRQYRKQVRILKHLRNKLLAEGFLSGKSVPSYLIESLVYNCPNSCFSNESYYADLRDIIVHLYAELKGTACETRMFEVNGLKYLFHGSQPWTKQEALNFILAVWVYVGFGETGG